jgi:GalNAc-alpha-(1->4)-GalNAc-alpha-(1->3)-diNAcBac-PP-undecaprenol alpha-1,4-N-acetyl-D-galactosaminyltransferase
MTSPRLSDVAGPIVLVTSLLGGGGAERVATTMANYWAGQGRLTIIVVLRRDAPAHGYPLHPSVRVERNGIIGARNVMWSVRPWLGLWRLRRGLVRLRPSLVLSFIDKMNVAVLLATVGLSVPVIVTEHLVPWRNPLGQPWAWARRQLYRRAHAVISPTVAIDGWLSRRVRANYRVLAYPVDLKPVLAAVRPRVRERLILAAGRLAPEKGFADLIQAFAGLPPEMNAWRLDIAGEGPERKNLEAYLARLPESVRSRVRLCGQVEDLAFLMVRAEVFVLSSHHEAYPMVLAEAMGAGCCPVATDCPTGPRQMLKAGVEGLLVPPEDPVALRDALLAVLQDEGLRRRLAAAAETAAKRLETCEIMRSWDQLVDQVAR